MLLVSAVQCESAIGHVYTDIPSVLSLPPTPILPLWVITEPRAELPALHNSIPPAVYFTHGNASSLKWTEGGHIV